MTEPMQKILIVDDDPEILEIIADILREGGYAVDTAPDGIKGIRHIDAEFYDLVITDLNLPEMDGMMVLKHVVDQSSDTMCVILTGYNYFRNIRRQSLCVLFNYK